MKEQQDSVHLTEDLRGPFYTCCEDGMLSQVPPMDRSGLCPRCHPDNSSLPQELIASLKDAARYLLQNGQTKQGLAVQACVNMLEDDSSDTPS